MADIHHHHWVALNRPAARPAGHIRWDRVSIVAACAAFHAAWIGAVVAAIR